MAEVSLMEKLQAHIDTIAPNIPEALEVTAVGVGVVFFVLVIMILFINLIKKLGGVLDKVDERIHSHHSKLSPDFDPEKVDETTLVLISAAVAAYTHNKGRVKRIRVLPTQAKRGGMWATQARSQLQRSHTGRI